MLQEHAGRTVAGDSRLRPPTAWPANERSDMPIDASRTVADLVLEQPSRARVLEHSIEGDRMQRGFGNA